MNKIIKLLSDNRGAMNALDIMIMVIICSIIGIGILNVITPSITGGMSKVQDGVRGIKGGG